MRYGSWARALERAGIDYAKIRLTTVWTRQLVVERILARKRRGLALNPEALEGKEANELLRQGRTLYGSWRAALREAGLEPQREYVHVRRSDQEILDAIRARAAQGRSLVSTQVELEEPGLYRAAQARWGGWHRACRAAGHDYVVQPGPTRKWTETTILNVLRARHRARKPLKVAEMPAGMITAVRRRYGGWEAACRAAGVPYRPVRRRPWTTSALEHVLIDFVRRHGAVDIPRLKRHDPALIQPIYLHFGSLGAARARVERLARR